MITESKIQAEADKADDIILEINRGNERGSFGMTYEEGVANALNWVLGHYDESPLDD